MTEPSDTELALWWLNQWPPWGWTVDESTPPCDVTVPPGHPNYGCPYHRYEPGLVTTYTVTLTRMGGADITHESKFDGATALKACVREAYRRASEATANEPDEPDEDILALWWHTQHGHWRRDFHRVRPVDDCDKYKWRVILTPIPGNRKGYYLISAHGPTLLAATRTCIRCVYRAFHGKETESAHGTPAPDAEIITIQTPEELARMDHDYGIFTKMVHEGKI